MSGAHDLGGKPVGPVQPEANEPAFHAEWERRVFALVLAMGATGEWNIDQSRFARESLPAEYASKTYYEIWLAGLERLLAARGLVSAQEIEAGRALDPRKPVSVLRAEHVATTLARGGPTARPALRAARFAPGDRVRARATQPRTHTRLPNYVHGRLGTVELVHGCHVFPDSNALGLGEDAQWLYNVRFGGADLWGFHADPRVAVSVDAFEPYLDPADE